MGSRLASFILSTSILIQFTFVSGCASFFGGGVPNDPVDRLRYDIDRVFADSIFRSTVPSLKVVAPGTGEVLYEANSEMFIRPASNMKILTSMTALHVLGPRYLFKTSLSWESLFDDETVNGNVYLKGYGNPDLRTADLDTLAAQLAAIGVKRIAGNVVVDDSFFDSLQWGPGWMWDDEPAPYQAYVSALSVNKNCINVTVAYDSATGGVTVTTDPTTSYVTVRNFATVATDSVTARLRINRPATEPPNTIVVAGQILAGDEPREDQLTVLWPELYAGTLMMEALGRQGISVDGVVERGRLPREVSEKAWHVWGIDSVIVNLNKVSDNLSAEMALKTISATLNSPPGSVASGRWGVNEYFASLGIDSARHRMADGSGLSHYSLLRVGLIVDLLRAVYDDPEIFPLFYQSLPVAGVDGTLEERMRGTRAQGNVRAKTGTISGVSSLSGYATTRDGEMLVFGMTMQDFIGSSVPYRRAQNRVCEILAIFSRSQPHVSR